ncbi:SusD/RagB family nutrient-binding outer membrane lipoprotein, partial [Candidatus Marinimicrobia bacterium]|nr:SusD/RagB family nutrient-binding outer membrane lipoprotein [Candidatus Neomarinimicrobiota bacterium]
TGGLVDLKTTQEVAESQEKYILLGISQMWEALLFSTAADLWGSIPYSQAANPNFPVPKFDSQEQVHFAVLDLIDSAILNFQKGQIFTLPSDYDFTFGADVGKWIAAAHTLKSRIYLNWAEVDNSYYQLALEEAQLGILDPSGLGDWTFLHGSAIAERSIWFQFILSNSDYMGAGKLLVDMLERDNDSRLNIYFLGNGPSEIFGVSPGDSVQNASMLNITGHYGMQWSPDFVTWYENNFIIAECHFNLGNEAIALSTLNETLDGIEQVWRGRGFASAVIPRYENISGDTLIAALMNEKYKALFLNIQSWSDWRRTGYPKFIDSANNSTECGSTDNGLGVPRRLLYPEKEKSSNPKCPQNAGIYDRLENDPF